MLAPAVRSSRVLRRPGRWPDVHGLLRRRPLPHWTSTVALAALSALVLARITGDATTARHAWGATDRVVVVAHDIDAGERLSGDDVQLRPVPRWLTPSGAVVAVPVGALAAVDLHGGEVLVRDRLAGARRSGAAARLPRGTRGIAVPNDGGLDVGVGDLVDVLATFDQRLADDGPPTITVARRAVVVATSEDATTVAVRGTEAAVVAYALSAGRVTLALVR